MKLSEVTKSARKERTTHGDVNAVLTGGASGAAAPHVTGAVIDRVKERGWEARTAADPKLKEILREHRKIHGLGRGEHLLGEAKWRAFFRSYPKELPGSAYKRAASWALTGKTGVAFTSAAAVGGGKVALDAKRKVAKATKQEKTGGALLAAGGASGLAAINTNSLSNAANAIHSREIDRKVEAARRAKAVPGADVKGLTTLEQKLLAARKRKFATGPRRSVFLRSTMGASIPMIAAGAHLAFVPAKHKVEKSAGAVAKREVTHRDVNAGLIGAAAGGAGYQGIGLIGRRNEKKWAQEIKDSPRLSGILAEHRKKVGLPKDAVSGDPAFPKFFREYPKELPGARFRRTASWTHNGKTGVLLSLGAAGLTGAGAVKVSRTLEDRKKSKRVPVAKRSEEMFAANEHHAEALRRKYPDAKITVRPDAVGGKATAKVASAPREMPNVTMKEAVRTTQRRSLRLPKNPHLIPVVATAGSMAVSAGALRHFYRKREMPNTVNKQDGVYPYLNANIREEVIGIPETRRNPISPMQMLASANIVASGYSDLKSRNPLFRNRRTKRGWHKIAMGTQMMDAPVGYGVML